MRRKRMTAPFPKSPALTAKPVGAANGPRGAADALGEPVHSGMYQQLWSNGPKECLEFANYTFVEHFGNGNTDNDVPSYPPRAPLLDYMAGRAQKFNVQPWIQFHTAVRRVTFDDATQLFTVVTQELKSKAETVQEFDYVFCATGHFHVPNVPSFPGFDQFPGRILHSHEIRSFQEFQNQRLLVVGTSYSAEDVVVQSYKYGCRDIVSCYRTSPMPFHWPDGVVVTKPLLTQVDGNVVTFQDGTTKEVDVIVLATGYLHSFPFMEQKLQLITENRLWIDSLYKGMVFRPNPRLFYMAMHDQWLTFNMFDAQAWYARDLILGKLQMPESQAAIQADVEKWASLEASLTDDESMIRFQTEYTADLVEATDYPSWDYEMTVQTFLDWEHAKHEDILGYRNQSHTSAFSGAKAPVPKVPFMENKDDSLEAFLKNY